MRYPRSARTALGLAAATAGLLPACGLDSFWVETVTPPTTTTSTSTSTTTTTTAPRRVVSTTTTTVPASTTTSSSSSTTTTTAPSAEVTPDAPPGAPGPGDPATLVAAPPPPPPPPPAPTTFPAPLTGLPIDPARAKQPVVVVKIDNAPKARPQIGLLEADVVFEEGVEGGITRFAALFHSKASEPVGPVRSARSTDIAIVSALNHPLFAYSGANDTFKRYLAEAPLVDVGVDTHPERYRRDPARPSPHNLFTATPELLDLAPEDAEAPPALFTYRGAGEPADATAGSRPVSRVQAQWKASKETLALWEWDPVARGWRRTQNAEPHVDAAGRQVAPPNVVMQFVTYRDTGLVDSSGAAVPEAEVIGSGEAWVLTGGRLIPCRWSKASAGEVTSYVDASGHEVRLAPGQTWVELVPPGQGTVLE